MALFERCSARPFWDVGERDAFDRFAIDVNIEVHRKP
jgi:hypothetical protein